MAINLWESAGKPTSYNPLPTGWGIFAPFGFATYILTLKAKSNSGATLRITDGGATILNKFVSLTNVFETYTTVIPSNESDSIYLYDSLSVGDIIIKDIKLVEKPMAIVKQPKSNLLLKHDPLLSDLPTRADVFLTRGILDFQNGIHFPTNGIGRYAYHAFKPIPGKVYNLSVFIKMDDGSVPVLSATSFSGDLGLVIHANLTGIDLNVTHVKGEVYRVSATGVASNDSVANYGIVKYAGQSNKGFVASGFQLTEGAEVRPFEPYVMSNPPAAITRNLFDKTKVTRGTVGASGGLFGDGASVYGFSDYIPVKKGEVSKSNSYNCCFYDSNKNFVQLMEYSTKVTVPADGFIVFNFDWDKLNQTEIKQRVNPNRQNAVWVPKKNLFDGVLLPHGFIGLNGLVDVNSPLWRHNPTYIEVKPNNNYSLKYTGSPGGYVFHYDGSKTFIGYVNVNANSNSILTPANTRFSRLCWDGSAISDVQFEEGSIKTPYEPFKIVNKSEPTGVIMDGVANYVLLPSMTMDSIEIDCIVETKNANSTIIDTVPRNEFVYAIYNALTIGGNNVSKFKSDETIVGTVVFNKRSKLKVEFITAITKPTYIFSPFNIDGNFITKGIIYSVKCFLNGKVVAEYDFTKENEKANAVIVGPKTWNIKQAKR